MKNKPSKRPLAISVISFLGIAGGLLYIPAMIAGLINIHPLAVLTSFIAFVGIWKMKKWAIYLYGISFIVQFFRIVILYHYYPFAYLLLPVITIGICVKYFNQFE